MIYKFNMNNFENTDELIKKVCEIHAKLFPNATLETQCTKYDKEYNEFIEAKNYNEIIKELADMFIVACGIKNKSEAIGYGLLTGILYKIKNASENDKDFYEAIYEFSNVVCNKMNKNQERSWNETTEGYYKHKVSIN